MRVFLAAGILALISGGIAADEIEYEIVFYWQPDGTGQNTENKSVDLDGDELTVEESGEPHNRYVEREPTSAEIDAISAFVMDSLDDLSLEASEDVEHPHIEVQVEFKTGATEAELTRVFPSGALPEDALEIQYLFFETPFE